MYIYNRIYVLYYIYTCNIYTMTQSAHTILPLNHQEALGLSRIKIN